MKKMFTFLWRKLFHKTQKAGNITININGSMDPKKVADEVIKVLKYNRSLLKDIL